VSRPKEFEPEAVVDAAKDLFWRRGYANTSMQDLVDHLGVGRGSIYDTFGSKHELWIQALAKYCDDGAQEILATLEGPGPLLHRLRDALLAMVDRDLEDSDRKGCMLVNAAMETLPGDPDTAKLARRNFTRIELGLEQAIRRAKLDHEVAESVDATAAASFVLTVIEGLRVVAKATSDRRRLVHSIDVALASLG
jgi:TetR/AcrR family transcriptional repressor of nem operon